MGRDLRTQGRVEGGRRQARRGAGQGARRSFRQETARRTGCIDSRQGGKKPRYLWSPSAGGNRALVPHSQSRVRKHELRIGTSPLMEQEISGTDGALIQP